jgi:hypothetical protein
MNGVNDPHLIYANVFATLSRLPRWPLGKS